MSHRLIGELLGLIAALAIVLWADRRGRRP